MSFTSYHGSHCVGVMDNIGKLDHRPYRITKALILSCKHGTISSEALVQHFHMSNVSNVSIGLIIIIISEDLQD